MMSAKKKLNSKTLASPRELLFDWHSRCVTCSFMCSHNVAMGLYQGGSETETPDRQSSGVRARGADSSGQRARLPWQNPAVRSCAGRPRSHVAEIGRAGYAAGGTAAKAVRLSMHFGSLRNVARSTGWLHVWPYCWLRSFRYLALNFVPRNASDLVLICNQL